MAKQVRNSLTDKKPEEGLLNENDFFIATGLTEGARKKYEEEGWIKPKIGSVGRKWYSPENVELGKAIKRYSDTGLPPSDAHELAIHGLPLKKRRYSEAGADRNDTIDPNKINTHSEFEGLLQINKGLLKEIIADMTANGYYQSKPVVLAKWKGQDEPVLIDGHTRMQAAIAAGIERIFFVIEEFEDEMGAQQHAMNLQTKRRITDDGVQARLIYRFDRLGKRGGDRRSEQAKSKPSQDGIEKGRYSSAKITGALAGCSATTVERFRRIVREGSRKVLESVLAGKTKITTAYNALVKKPQGKGKKTTKAKSAAGENQAAMVRLTDENLAALKRVERNASMSMSMRL